MLELPEVTLCAVDTRHPSLAIRALERSQSGIHFARVLLVTSRGVNLPASFAGDVERIAPLHASHDYSMFILCGLHRLIRTRFVLIVQWDGYVLHPSAWDDEFLACDYVGAIWPHHPLPISVGNGGFSLRSLRLLEATASSEFVPTHPEDISICHLNRNFLETQRNLRFAPPALARKFSFERETPMAPTFGFHALFNFPAAMSMNELADCLGQLPDKSLLGRDAHDLARNLLSENRVGSAPLARRILRARVHAGKPSWETMYLLALATVRSWLPDRSRRIAGAGH